MHNLLSFNYKQNRIVYCIRLANESSSTLLSLAMSLPVQYSTKLILLLQIEDYRSGISQTCKTLHKISQTASYIYLTSLSDKLHWGDFWESIPAFSFLTSEGRCLRYSTAIRGRTGGVYQYLQRQVHTVLGDEHKDAFLIDPAKTPGVGGALQW